MSLLVISYSRPDQPAVRGIVKLLRAAYRGIDRAVYWDDDFEPGDPWFEQMKRHIDEAGQLFVFWCEHSARSEAVDREFRYALSQAKVVVPVLLDHTPLVQALAPLHGVDLREVFHAPSPRLDGGDRFESHDRDLVIEPSLPAGMFGLRHSAKHQVLMAFRPFMPDKPFERRLSDLLGEQGQQEQ